MVLDTATETTAPGNAKEPRVHDLTKIMERIDKYANNEEEGGIYVFKGKDAETASHKAANTVYDGLMLTLDSIGEYALEKVAGKSPLAQEYETVMRAVEPMTQVCRALADDKLPLREQTGIEQRHAQVDDTVHSYAVTNYRLGDTDYRYIRVFIRPRLYQAPPTVRNQVNRPEVTLVEKADPRMSITMQPVSFPYGEITVRVDQEDLEHNMEISYDVGIDGKEQDMLRHMEFGDHPQVLTGQRDGHHFSSSITAKQLGVSFTDILGAFNAKFAKVAHPGTPSVPPIS